MDPIETRRMLIVAAAIGQNIGDLWSVYQELIEGLDLNDPNNAEVMFDLLAEMEANLIDILDQVGGQIYLFTGMFEPIPHDRVDDFESSVLKTLAGLDKVDLEQYRVPEFGEGNE